MVGLARLLILGAGVFGRLAQAEARARGHEAVCAGRASGEARADADREGSVRDALRAARADALLHAAGPFRERTDAAARAARAAGVPYADVSEDEKYTRRALDLPPGTPVLPGMSTTPALSHALARRALARAPDAAAVRWAMWSGGGNRQGPATLAFAAEARLSGPCEAIDFPGVGRRTACPARIHASPLPPGVEGRAVVAVGGLAALGWRSAWLTRRAARLAPLLPRVSRDDSGALVADALDGQGRVLARASLHASWGGQRMAVLPALWALEEAMAGRAPARAAAPWEWVDEERLLSFLVAAGFERRED